VSNVAPHVLYVKLNTTEEFRRAEAMKV